MNKLDREISNKFAELCSFLLEKNKKAKTQEERAVITTSTIGSLTSLIELLYGESGAYVLFQIGTGLAIIKAKEGKIENMVINPFDKKELKKQFKNPIAF